MKGGTSQNLRTIKNIVFTFWTRTLVIENGVAARIADKQTGLVTSLGKLTPEHLSTLLSEVLSNLSYRVNAGKTQKAIGSANGLAVAADLIEDSLSVTKKVSHAG